MQNPYKYDSWEWRVQDALCRKIADGLGLDSGNKWCAALQLIFAQRPMMYLPARAIQKMITCSDSSRDITNHWHVCSEFLDLADMLLLAAEEQP